MQVRVDRPILRPQVAQNKDSVIDGLSYRQCHGLLVASAKLLVVMGLLLLSLLRLSTPRLLYCVPLLVCQKCAVLARAFSSFDSI